MSIIRNIILLVIYLYRTIISPIMPPRCRFIPSCSVYAEEAIKLYGLKGLGLVLCRILRCHPFGGAGVDEVPNHESIATDNKE